MCMCHCGGSELICSLCFKIRSVTVDSDGAGRQNHSLRSFILAPIPTTSHTRTLCTIALNRRTTFYIKNTFSISGRQSIVFEGEIINGTINNGQRIKLEQTDSHPAIELVISSVEFVDHLADKIANVGLMIKIEQSDDLTDLLNYRIKDETCQII